MVPYTKTLDNPLDAKINSLDQDMTDILAKKMNFDEKMKLYGQALNKFATLYNPESFSMPSVLATMNKKLDGLEDQLDVIPNMPEVLATMNKKLDSLEDQLDGIPNSTLRPDYEAAKKSKKRKNTELNPNLILETKRSKKNVERYGSNENEKKKSKKNASVVFPDLNLNNESNVQAPEPSIKTKKSITKEVKAGTSKASVDELTNSVSGEKTGVTQNGEGLAKKWCTHKYF